MYCMVAILLILRHSMGIYDRSGFVDAMRPEISAFLRTLTYPNLTDALLRLRARVVTFVTRVLVYQIELFAVIAQMMGASKIDY
jgi:hypothetical protein